MSVKKIIYIVIGCITLALGCVGIALPILPTTPFLLVTAFCFAKSSERLDRWFKGTKIYKNNLESYVRGLGMDNKTKLRIMTTVTIVMAIACALMYKAWHGQVAIAVVWVAHVIAFVFFIKTPEQVKARNEKKADEIRAKAIADGENPDKAVALFWEEINKKAIDQIEEKVAMDEAKEKKPDEDIIAEAIEATKDKEALALNQEEKQEN